MGNTAVTVKYYLCSENHEVIYDEDSLVCNANIISYRRLFEKYQGRSIRTAPVSFISD